MADFVLAAEEQRTTALLEPVADGGEPSSASRQRAARAGLRNVSRSVAIVSLLPLAFGFALGFTSPALAELARALELSPGQSAAFSSLINVGAMIASLGSGRFADRWGRKPAIGLSACLGVVGWLLVAVSAHLGVWALLTGRVITGCAAGMAAVCVNVYVAEVSPARLRGALGAAFQVAVTLGILSVYALGIILDYVWLAIVGAVPCALLLVALPLITESPRWQMVQGDVDGARRSLAWLRGEDCLDDELSDVVERSPRPSTYVPPPLSGAPAPHGGETGAPEEDEAVDEVVRGAAHDDRAEPPSRDAAGNWLGVEAWVLRPLGLSVVLMICQQLSGINAVIFFSAQILRDANFAAMAGDAALAVAAAQVVVTVAAVPLIELFGRRPLLLCAASGMAVSQTTISAFFLTGRRMPGLALVGLCGAVASFSLGMGAIPWSLMGEIFPQDARAVASSIATLTNWSCSFAVTLSFEALVQLLGEGGLFAVYAAVCGFTVAFVAASLPETKGRTLEEIEREFRSGDVQCSRAPSMQSRL